MNIKRLSLKWEIISDPTSFHRYIVDILCVWTLTRLFQLYEAVTFLLWWPWMSVHTFISSFLCERKKQNSSCCHSPQLYTTRNFMDDVLIWDVTALPLTFCGHRLTEGREGNLYTAKTTGNLQHSESMYFSPPPSLHSTSIWHFKT